MYLVGMEAYLVIRQLEKLFMYRQETIKIFSLSKTIHKKIDKASYKYG